LQDFIFAGTWGDGVYRSNDQATSWTKLSTTGLTNLYITDIKVGLNGHIFITTMGGGIFRSTDNGATWVGLNTGIDNLNMKCIWVSGNNSDTLFAGSYGSGVYRSYDAGTNWTKVNTGINYRDITCLFRTSDGKVYAGTYGGGIFRSENMGRSWSGVTGITGKARFINSIYFAKNSSKLFACTNGDGLYESVNDGKSWAEFSDPSQSNITDNNVTSAIEYKVGNNITYVVGTRHRGVFYYKTVIDNFFRQGGFQNGVTCMVQTSTNNIILAGPGDLTRRSTDGGVSWQLGSSTNLNANAKFKLFDSKSLNVLFATIPSSTFGLYRSTDKGSTWEVSGFVGARIHDLIVSKTGKLLVKLNATPRQGFWRSLDTGKTWVAFGTADSSNAFAQTANGDIYTVTQLPGAAGPPATQPTARIRRSTDDGETYTLQAGVVQGVPFGIFAQNNDVFVVGTNFTTGATTVNRSTNQATSFTSVFTSTFTLNDVEVTPNNTIYMGTSNGLYRSTNGTAFSQVSMGFVEPNADLPENVNGIASLSDTELFAGMGNADGVYKTTDNGVNWDSVNTCFSVSDVGSVVRTSDKDVFFTTSGIYKYVNPLNIEVPKLLSPANNVGKIPIANPSFTWSSAKNAELYELQITTIDDFSAVNYRYTLKDTTFTTYDTLIGSTTYYWRVRSKHFGSFSDWAVGRSFKTKLDAPRLWTPANLKRGVKTSKAPLAWSPVYTNSSETISRYDYQIASSTSFTSIASTSFTADTTALAVGKLQPLTTYYWRAKSGTADNESEWSGYNEFRTTVGAPSLRTPSNRATKIPVELSLTWDTTREATDYFVQVSKDSLFSGANVIIEKKSESATFAEIENLEYNTRYWWRVQAANSEGTGDYGDAWSFTTGVQSPTLIIPDSSKTKLDTAVTLRWSSIKDAVSYRVQVATDINFSNIIFENSSLTVTERQLPGLNHFTTYYWKVNTTVKSKDNVNFVSDFSPTWQFRTKMDTVELFEPTNSATLTIANFFFKWNLPLGVQSWHIQVSRDPSFNSTSIVAQDSNLSITQKDYPNLPKDVNLYWRVRGKNNEDGVGAWSETRMFQIVVASVALDEMKQSVQIAPNPYSSDFNLRFTAKEPSMVEIKLLDLTGSELMTIMEPTYVLNSKELNVTDKNLPIGTYFLQFKVGNDVFYKEIQKVK